MTTIMKGAATIGDLVRIPKDGRKHELVEGRILVSPAGMRHARTSGRILHVVATYLEDNPIGEVYADNVGIILPNGNLRSPDVTFVRHEKLPGGESPAAFGELVPDLAVEVLSPEDDMNAVIAKVGEFLDCGAPLVWLADPDQRTVTVYRSLSDSRRLTAEDTIDGGDALPGFRCRVGRFF